MKTTLVRMRDDDLEWVEQMRKQLVMSDGKNRNVASIMHTILKNARRLTGDEMELLDEEG